jgi:hypothetical protein
MRSGFLNQAKSAQLDLFLFAKGNQIAILLVRLLLCFIILRSNENHFNLCDILYNTSTQEYEKYMVYSYLTCKLLLLCNTHNGSKPDQV